ncbi:cation:proton antiporter [Aureibacter tunicatorum]|uniref:Kef-type K+ transport system membrane component KefB n=1 Tax=Aureibacter tunicatorum TaxID=866807 RepID=A0AAE4BRC3_9BACT|nr:cation:proton antiporter [Aureibacter tunicatorum]MDR6237625.1 Kef-type K+ transport system membrane component KefB [Aureibacter tunicatorum]BDD02660.1 hypothetical protein AUTU_01430 [Aureibacter tunicatorum]
MEKLNHSEIITLLLQLSILLASSRLLAELVRKLKQPGVVGEILAGVLLGPTFFGAFFPEAYDSLFPAVGNSSIILDGLFTIGVILLLFIAGLEVELPLVWQQGKRAVYVSLCSLFIPIIVGFGCAYSFPEFFGSVNEEQRVVFALFLGTTLSITALPVIARILMDLNIFKSKMGMLIIASAMIIDILGWFIFTIILSMMETGEQKIGLWHTIGLTLGFTMIMLTIGKVIIDRSLPWINKKLAWPGGVLSLSMALCFLAAAFTESIGIHSIFGAFIVGIAMGDSVHFSERAKEIVHQFINNIFAPLFFVSIGLYVNFIDNFNLMQVLAITGLAFVVKVFGALLGARLGGMNNNDSLIVGFGMNTHGTLEVILGTIALSAGLITEELFVSIVVMVIVTIIFSAPIMKYFIGKSRNE